MANQSQIPQDFDTVSARGTSLHAVDTLTQLRRDFVQAIPRKPILRHAAVLPIVPFAAEQALTVFRRSSPWLSSPFIE